MLGLGSDATSCGASKFDRRSKANACIHTYTARIPDKSQKSVMTHHIVITGVSSSVHYNMNMPTRDCICVHAASTTVVQNMHAANTSAESHCFTSIKYLISFLSGCTLHSSKGSTVLKLCNVKELLNNMQQNCAAGRTK